MLDKQAVEERRVFRLFAKAAGLAIPEESIESCKPPEPDICCELPGHGPTAFELVEAIDPRLAQTVAAHKRLQDSLRERAAKGLDGFGDALVFVRFGRNTLVQQRVRAIGDLVDYLATLPAGFAGDPSVRDDSPLGSVVCAVRVTRGAFVGPLFQVEGGLFISDPIIESIERKFGKTYQWEGRLELLAFYALQSTPMVEFRVPEVETFIHDNLARSRFARVWVFDAETRKVLLSCDASSRSQNHAV